jgi:hypothetical protein
MFAREGEQLLAKADNCLTFRALLYLDLQTIWYIDR